MQNVVKYNYNKNGGGKPSSIIFIRSNSLSRSSREKQPLFFGEKIADKSVGWIDFDGYEYEKGLLKTIVFNSPVILFKLLVKVSFKGCKLFLKLCR